MSAEKLHELELKTQLIENDLGRMAKAVEDNTECQRETAASINRLAVSVESMVKSHDKLESRVDDHERKIDVLNQDKAIRDDRGDAKKLVTDTALKVIVTVVIAACLAAVVPYINIK